MNFVLRCRAERHGRPFQPERTFLRPHKDDIREIEHYDAELIPSISCWKRLGKDADNNEALSKELLRCCPEYMGTKEWRKDTAWIQEYSADQGALMDGKIIG